MKSPLVIFLVALPLALGNASHAADQVTPAAKPNILLILADKLGGGDVSCCNDRPKVATPKIGLLAHDGMRFSDAHSPVCISKASQAPAHNSQPTTPTTKVNVLQGTDEGGAGNPASSIAPSQTGGAGLSIAVSA